MRFPLFKSEKLKRLMVRLSLMAVLVCPLYAAETPVAPAGKTSKRRIPVSITPQNPRTSPSAPWVIDSENRNSNFGFSAGTAGDVNGDGFADIIVGARMYNATGPADGKVFVYYGSSDGIRTTPDWSALGDMPRTWFGASVACAGDVNGDGLSDVIIGAHRYNANHGKVSVYLGSKNGLSREPAWVREQPIGVGGNFGYCVASAGDVNGDGKDDIIIGAPSVSPERDYKFVAVYYGTSQGISDKEAWIAENFQIGSQFGSAVSSAGDVNGDGFDDIIIGAPQDSREMHGAGMAVVYLGSKVGLSHKPDWTVQGDQAESHFGFSVATAGDINGDGFADVIVAAPNYSGNYPNEGKVSVYYGSREGLPPTPNWWALGNSPGARFGSSVQTAGDVNHDGFDDIIVGATTDVRGREHGGNAYVFYGSRTGLGTKPGWTGQGEQKWSEYGVSVGTAGDVNGDGCSDVIVGAFMENDSFSGRVSVYPGARSGLGGGTVHSEGAVLPIGFLAPRQIVPFWQAWWFAGLIGVTTVATGGWMVQHFSLRRERARVNLLRTQNALNEERARIAKDMHDGLGANLTHMTLLSELVKQNVGRPEQVLHHAEKLALTARTIVQTMDEIVWALNPRNDSLESFVTYLSRYADDYLDSHRIRCWQEWPNALPTFKASSDVRHHLYLIVKEALHNVVKHAAASEVWMKLEFQDAMLALTIKDNGQGFSLLKNDGTESSEQDERRLFGHGNGLRNMRQRMEQLGGTFSMISEPRRGTQIRLSLRLQE